MAESDRRTPFRDSTSDNPCYVKFRIRRGGLSFRAKRGISGRRGFFLSEIPSMKACCRSSGGAGPIFYPSRERPKLVAFEPDERCPISLRAYRQPKGSTSSRSSASVPATARALVLPLVLPLDGSS